MRLVAFCVPVPDPVAVLILITSLTAVCVPTPEPVATLGRPRINVVDEVPVPLPVPDLSAAVGPASSAASPYIRH